MSIKDVQDKLIERNAKPKPKKIDKIVKGVLIYWCAFVILAWVTFWVKDAVPDTLITAGLGGGAVELVISGMIEIFRDKIHKGD